MINAERAKNSPDFVIGLQPDLNSECVKYPESYYRSFNQFPSGQYASGFTNIAQSAIGNTGSQSITFQLVTTDSLLDFSQMTLSFIATVGLPNTTANQGLLPLANTCGLFPFASHFPWLSSCSLQLNTGIKIVDIPNLDLYSKSCAWTRLDYKDLGASSMRGFACKSQRYGSINYTTANPTQFIADPYLTIPTNGTITQQYPAESNDDPAILLYPNNYNTTTGGGGSATQPPIFQNSTYDNNGNKVLPYVEINDVTKIYAWRISVRLGDIMPDSVFNVKRDIYVNSNSILSLNFNPVNKIFNACAIQSGALPYANYGDLSLAGGNATAVYEIWYPQLLVVYNGNQKIIEKVLEEQNVGSGIPIIIPYVQNTQSISFNYAGKQINTVEVSSQAALSSLSHIYYQIYSNTTGFVNNSNNINELLYNYFVVKDSGQQICDYDLKNTMADYNIVQKLFPKNSFVNYSAFRYLGMNVVVFDSSEIPDKYEDGVSFKGIPILNQNSRKLTFEVNSVTANTLTHQAFIVTKRCYWFRNGTVDVKKPNI